MTKYLNFCLRKTGLKKKLYIRKIGRLEMVVKKDGGSGCFSSLFIKKIKVIMCFQFLKKKKEARKRREGRKLNKAAKENTTVGTESSTQTDVLRKLHFRDICLCARLEKKSCGQQVFSQHEGWSLEESEL